jgi:hypothetical protein
MNIINQEGKEYFQKSSSTNSDSIDLEYFSKCWLSSKLFDKKRTSQLHSSYDEENEDEYDRLLQPTTNDESIINNLIFDGFYYLTSQYDDTKRKKKQN